MLFTFVVWIVCLHVYVFPSAQAWERWNLPENGRPEVPLSEVGDDECGVAGMAIDFTSVQGVQRGEFI